MSRAALSPNGKAFSFNRMRAVLVKEFIQLTRDRLTYALILVVPIMQMLLFGYAINTDPCHLPTALLVRRTACSRGRSPPASPIPPISTSPPRPAARPSSTGWCAPACPVRDHHPGRFLAARDPRRLRPDPRRGRRDRSHRDGQRARRFVPLPGRSAPPRPDRRRGVPRSRRAVRGRDQRRYNPENITAYNIVPGLLGIVLTLTTGHADRDRRDPRAGTRHDGASARHAWCSRSR